MNELQAFILGIIEGITEFLPISSTGHLILFSRLLGVEPSDFSKTFEIFIQLGAILAVVVLYGPTLFTHKQTFQRVAVAFIPTAVLGFVFYGVIKTYLLGNNTVVLAALLVGGLLLILFEKFYKQHPDGAGDTGSITYKHALLIGLFQALAFIPGTSRAAATILGGLFLGLKRQTAVEFSFLLSVPTMLAAVGLDLFETGFAFSQQEVAVLLIGALTAFAVALFAIKFLLRFIQSHTFTPFGIYRIIIAVVFMIIFTL